LARRSRSDHPFDEPAASASKNQSGHRLVV
jgi:hypothetical protein